MRVASILGTVLVCAIHFWAQGAHASTIVVNTESDSIADNGRCSLREAITAANTGKSSGSRPGECMAGHPAPIVDVIQLPKGLYKLQRGHAGENRNLEGDLDITEPVVVQGAGRDETIIRNAVGDRRIRGDGDRLFHIDPAAKGRVNVTLLDLTVGNGDVGCSGENCSAGASAVEASGNGALTLDRVSVQLNSFTCSGIGCGRRDNAAIRAIGGGPLTIRRSVIKRNRAYCKDERCNAGSSAILMSGPNDSSPADFVLEKTLIKANTSACEAAECVTDQIVEVHARTVNVRSTPISQNKVGCSGPHCGAGDVIALKATKQVIIDGAVVSKNVVLCTEEGCGAGGVVLARGDTGLVMRAVVAEDNASRCGGPGCSTAEQLNLQAEQGDVSIEAVELNDDVANCLGDGCATRAIVLLSSSGESSVVDTIVSGGLTSCTGEACHSDQVIGAIGGNVAIARSQLLDNRALCDGARCSTNAVHELYAALGTVAVEDTSIERNGSVCFGDNCYSGPVNSLLSDSSKVVMERTALASNFTTCDAGDGCFTSGVLRVSGYQGVGVETLSLRENQIVCEGVACVMDQLAELVGSSGGVDIDDLSVDSNGAQCSGRECAGSEIFYIRSGAASSLRNGSFQANISKCDGPNCTVGFGGALRNAALLLKVSNTSFGKNETDGFGAAVFNDPGSELILDRVFMMGNRAGSTSSSAGYGGAIYNYGESGNLAVLRITNSEIRGNEATRLGGGILNTGAIPTISNSQITGNTPDDCINVGGTGCPTG